MADSPRFAWLARLTVDLSPLRLYPDFRRLWLGQALSTLGSELTVVAVPFQVFRLTHSTLAVGALGLAELVPWLGVGIVGGAFADRLDRRRIMVGADAGSLICSAALAANGVLPVPSLGLIYLVVFLAGGFGAAHRTAMRSSIPRLVGVEMLTRGGALENLYYQSSAIAGPALAGLAIAGVGLTATYLVDGATFGFSILMLLRMSPIAPHPEAEPVSLRSIKAGFSYVISSPVVFSSQLVDLSAMFFGMPNALFPALAQRLGGGARLLGLLFAAPAVGALILSVFSAPFTRVRRQGWGLIAAATIWGAAIVLLGVSGATWLAVVALVIAGAADAVSGIFRTALVLTVTPDSMRGRMSGVELVFYSSGPLLGDFESGALGAVVGVPVAIAAGGLACLVGTLGITLKYPQLRAYAAPAAEARWPGASS